jgi:small subunit ribosomal protein S17
VTGEKRRVSGRKQLVGRVVSDKMDKTVVVRVERLVRHSRYGKVLRLSKKYKAHDEKNTCRVDDVVCIVESRPLSREKRWRVKEILRRSEAGVAVEGVQ